MSEPAPVPAEAPSAPGLLRRPAVLAALGMYLACLGGLAVWLYSTAGPEELPTARFPQYEFSDAWVASAFPHLHQESPQFAKIRFRDRVDEMRWLAELYEGQKSWGKAARCYEEIALLIPAEGHEVNRYVRGRMRVLARREE